MYVSNNRGILFTKLKICLIQFGAFLQISQKKTEKEKRNEKGKREKVVGRRFGPEPELAHGPATRPPPPPRLNWYPFPPSLSLTAGLACHPPPPSPRGDLADEC
jgi:hypothetical protein